MFKLITLFAATLVATQAMAEISDLNQGQINTIRNERDYVGVINPMSLDKSKSSDDITAGGYNELMKFVVPAPDQEDAGSCLYMSHTGVVEWWYNRLNNLTGSNKMDLAERYYMSLKTEKTNQDVIENWRTDNIRRVNKSSIFFKNTDYRFTKGHFKKVDGKRVVTDSNDEDASYGTSYNWINLTNEISNRAEVIKLPKFKREVLYADADQDQWAVAKAPVDIVERIKIALHKRNAPVLVIYNHKGFWHANYIFGYNDNADTEGCPFVSSFIKRMQEKYDYWIDKSKATKSDSWREKYLGYAAKSKRREEAVQSRFEEVGGCAKKGVFYVRDSIYGTETMPQYDYDFSRKGEEGHLNSPLIAREFAWVQTTLNHAIQIYPEGME